MRREVNIFLKNFLELVTMIFRVLVKLEIRTLYPKSRTYSYTLILLLFAYYPTKQTRNDHTQQQKDEVEAT